MRLPLLAFAFLQAVSPSPRPQNKPETSAKPESAQAKQRGTDSLPLSVKLLNTGKSTKEAAQDSERIADSKKADARNFTLTIVLASATVVQAVALIMTILVMMSTARRQLRAYVSVGWGSIATSQGESHPGGFQVRVLNHGQTPAIRASTSAQLKILTKDELNSFDFPEWLDGDETGDTILHPDKLLTLRSHNIEPRLTDDEWRFVERGTDDEGRELWLCCWGVSRYRDVFRKQHWTRYCYRYGGSYSRDDGSGNAGKAAMSHRHNDTSDSPDPTLPAPPRNQPGLDDFGRPEKKKS
jgi:hypothetical protein